MDERRAGAGVRWSGREGCGTGMRRWWRREVVVDGDEQERDKLEGGIGLQRGMWGRRKRRSWRGGGGFCNGHDWEEEKVGYEVEEEKGVVGDGGEQERGFEVIAKMQQAGIEPDEMTVDVVKNRKALRTQLRKTFDM